MLSNFEQAYLTVKKQLTNVFSKEEIDKFENMSPELQKATMNDLEFFSKRTKKKLTQDKATEFDLECYMPLEEAIQDVTDGCLSDYDGSGYWAISDGDSFYKSPWDFSIYELDASTYTDEDFSKLSDKEKDKIVKELMDDLKDEFKGHGLFLTGIFWYGK